MAFKYSVGDEVYYKAKRYTVQFRDKKGVRDPKENVYYLTDGPMVKESELRKA